MVAGSALIDPSQMARSSMPRKKPATKVAPRAFSLLTFYAAGGAVFLKWVLNWVLGRTRYANEPRLPHVREWMKLYRSSRRSQEVALLALGADKSSPLVQELRGLAEGAADGAEFPPTLEMIETSARELGPAMLEEGGLQRLRSMMESPPVQFMLRVILPCAVLYRDHPVRLLRRARQGDDDAFEKLLRLDKSILEDPVLANRWHELMQDPKPARRKRFREAMAGLPKVPNGVKWLRTAMAGYISQSAEEHGVDLTAPEIRRLFCDFAPGGYLSDEDMPAGEALTKSLQRNRNWPAKKRKRK